MRGVTIVFALLVLMQVSQAAVLLRFINTVPTRLPSTSRRTSQGLVAYAAGTSREADDSVINFGVDRVGLLYTVTDGSTQSATTVWTELRGEAALAGKTSPYSWIFGMPPLRAYHGPTTVAITESSNVDRVANYQDNNAEHLSIHPSCDDLFVQSQLKADGLGLYLSFAPGRYNIGAYGVRGGTTSADMATAHSNVGQRFSSADKVMDFQDGQVYTLVAIGNGNFGANSGAGSFGDSAAVRLVLIQESTAPTTFGMASLRFFHAIQAASADTINIQDTTTKNTIVTGLAFGSVSAYADYAPKTQRDFAVVRSSNTQVPLAPTDALPLGASMDIRAGLRATVICANTDLQNPTVFCRMIPSRVVAYVRFVNDNAGNLNYALGQSASQRMQDINLSLWASYYYPFPSQVQEQSQVLETRCARTDGSALNNRGLYPVVLNIPASSVSDYGEVHVPLFIMDYAVRSVVRESDCRAAPAAAVYNTITDDPQTPTNAANMRWFDMAPVFKRVNFIVKTSGFATVSGRSDGSPRKIPTLTARTNFDALLLSEYMEPGQYYTLASTPQLDATNFAALQLGSHSRFLWRLDASIASVASGIAANTGAVRFIPLPNQDLTGQALSISGRSATFGGFTNNFVRSCTGVAPICTRGAQALWVAPTAADTLALAAGTYTFSSPAAATPCINSIPSGSFTVQEGQALDIFVLGNYACTQNSASLSIVQKTPALAQLPTSQCNPASAPTSFLIGAAGHVSPASLIALFSAALLAALMMAL